MGRVLLRAGEEAPPHRHPNCEEVLHLVTGRVELMIDDEIHTLERGDTAVIAPRAWHRVRALGEVDAHLLICYSSPRRVTEFGVEHAGFDQQTIQ